MSASSCCVTCGMFSQARCRCGPDRRLIRDSGLVSIGPNLLKSCAGISGMPLPVGAAAGDVVAGPCRMASTSSLVMRPFSPVPRSLVRSTPSSRASRRTPGLACASPGPAAEGAAAVVGGGAVGWGGAVAGSCCDSSEGGWVMAPSLPRSVRMAVPWLTLSPTLTSTFSTVPPEGAGTSIVALSDSSDTSGSSALTGSPSFTWISTIGTFLKSPISGTVTSVAVMAVSLFVLWPVSLAGFLWPARRDLRPGAGRCCLSAGRGVRLRRIDAVFGDRRGHHGGRDRSLLRQRREGGDRYVVAVHLEEGAQVAAIVGAAEAIGAQHEVAAGDKGADLVGERLHVVGGSNHRTFCAGQADLDVALPARLGRVEHVPALHLQALATQFGEAWHAPDIGGDAEIGVQQFGRRYHLAQDRATAEQLYPLVAGARARFQRTRFQPTGLKQVHSLQDAGLRALRQCRVLVVLVHQGDVEVDVLLIAIHAAQAVLHDHRHFIGKCRIIGDAVGHSGRQDVAVPVLVLQPLAVQRGAPGGAAEQETARAHVTGRPEQVADPLEPEHRIVDVEWDHRDVVGAV